MIDTPDPCAAVFNALAVTVKASGLKVVDRPSDNGLTEEEKLVLAYLRHRTQGRADDSASRLPTQAMMAPEPTKSEEANRPAFSESEKAPSENAPIEADTPTQSVRPQNAGQNADAPAAGLAPVLRRHRLPQPVTLTPPMQSPPKADNLQKEGKAEHSEGIAAEAEGNAMDSRPTEKEEADMQKGMSGVPQVGATPPVQPERVSLPNAKAKTPYVSCIEGYANLRMRNDGGSGLVLGDGGKVSAEEIPPGEYKIEMGGIKDGRAVSILVRLSVIPRPQDLWTSIPSDQTAPHAKPDEEFKAIAGDAFMVAASKRGRSHAKDGTFRDDHFELLHDEKTGWHVMVVADGAGSAPLSREGSRVACNEAMNALKKLLPELIDPVANSLVRQIMTARSEEERRSKEVLEHLDNSLMRAAHYAAMKLENHAKTLECRVADLSTTLVIAAAKKVDGKWLLMSFSIGDGGVGVWDSVTGDLSLMCQPDSGEYAGQTRFLAADELAEGADRSSRVFVDVREDFTAFMAMTDGITDPKFETDAALANPDMWRALWDDDLTKEVTFSQRNASLEMEFMGWMDFWSRGNHDDRTLAVMVTKNMKPASGDKGKAI